LLDNKYELRSQYAFGETLVDVNSAKPTERRKMNKIWTKQKVVIGRLKAL